MPSNAMVKMSWMISALSSYAFMACTTVTLYVKQLTPIHWKLGDLFSMGKSGEV
jgi:hypothetical protein